MGDIGTQIKHVSVYMCTNHNVFLHFPLLLGNVESKKKHPYYSNKKVQTNC